MDATRVNAMMDRYSDIVQYSMDCGGRTRNLSEWVDDIMTHFGGQVHGCYLSQGHPLEQFFGPLAHFIRFNDDIDGIGIALMRWRGGNVFGWESIDMTDPRNEIARQAVAILFKDALPDYYDDDLHLNRPVE